jgi:hypothetical protein
MFVTGICRFLRKACFVLVVWLVLPWKTWMFVGLPWKSSWMRIWWRWVRLKLPGSGSWG